ncbi:MAG: biotin/lipoyl-binding protein [Nitrospira sp.]|nr:biotin/lipoyl-binding protein [Nitrospira sp.]
MIRIRDTPPHCNSASGRLRAKEGTCPTVVSAAQEKAIQASVVKVNVRVPIRVEVTGQVALIVQTTLPSRIHGTIDKLLVREGAKVFKGQVLIRLDRRDLRTDLARADADGENRKAHRDRMDQLCVQDAVSKQEMENETMAHRVAEENRKAAEAQLSYTAVRAPFNGVIIEKRLIADSCG